jgi:hypothetical protein
LIKRSASLSPEACSFASADTDRAGSTDYLYQAWAARMLSKPLRPTIT